MTRQSRETRQKEVMNEIASKINHSFDADEFYNFVKKKDKNIGIATVYRFLRNMRRENKIYSYTCDKKIIYSRKKSAHCHYVCEKTGKIIHFDLDSLDFLKKIKEKIPGKINSIQIEIKGLCEDCENKD